MKEYTYYNDIDNNRIFEGDILYNMFFDDLWIVEKVDDDYEAWLIPYIDESSEEGILEEYPLYSDGLYYVCDSFRRIGSKYKDLELLEGFNYKGNDMQSL